MSSRVDPRRLRFYLNHTWGTVRTESRSYPVEQGTVLAGMDERAQFPLFGFQLPAESYPLAEWTGSAARVFPPPAAQVEHSGPGGHYLVAAADALGTDGGRRFVTVPVGGSVRLREGDQLLVVTVDEQRERAGWDKQKAAFWLIFLIVATLGAPIAFLLAGPDPGLVSRALEQARVKQGLPAKPTPIEIAPLPEDDGTAKKKGYLLHVTTGR
ncbi:MAG TPA: hypothetical protein VE782_12515 [Myxococcaceae bacterium]|nr:hypothetical protein [Myxococcaceae bacterium]